MHDVVNSRRSLRDLARTLATEYAGALAPGRVLALVYRTDAMVGRSGRLPASARLSTCEAIARRLLAEAVVREGAHTRASA